jgi:hypothetical protein
MIIFALTSPRLIWMRRPDEDATDPEFSWRDSLLYNENVQPVVAAERSIAKASSEKTYVPEIIAQARNLQTALRETNASRRDAELLAAVMPKTLPNETSLVHGSFTRSESGRRQYRARIAPSHFGHDSEWRFGIGSRCRSGLWPTCSS